VAFQDTAQGCLCSAQDQLQTNHRASSYAGQDQTCVHIETALDGIRRFRRQRILTMYRQAFGLRKDPFNLTPDPGFLYLTAQHREALVGLTYAILQRKGFVVMTGEAGTGKTTLLARVLQFLPATKLQFSIILNPTLTPSEFLEMALLDFGLSNIPSSKAQRLWKLQNLILQGASEGKVAALVVDEAHKLSPEVLEEIRLLGNFEDADQKLLQILLVGQAELNDVLDRDDLRQLKQRVAVRLSIGPLAMTEVDQYIRHRWLRAGGTKAPFSGAAVEKIADMSRGIPRLINSLCENALTLALGEGCVLVDRQHVEAAASDLHVYELLTQSEPDPMPPQIAPPETINEPGEEANGAAAQAKFSRWPRWAGRLRHKTT
jgi:general secretion pathway protein A